MWYSWCSLVVLGEMDIIKYRYLNMERISNEVQKLISTLCKDPSPDTVQELTAYSNKIFNSLFGVNSLESTDSLRQRCLEKATLIYPNDQKTVLRSQEMIHKILTSRSLVNKAEALKLILRLSEDAANSTPLLAINNTFKSESLKRHQQDFTSSTIVEELPRTKEMPEQLSIIRTKGSPEQGASEEQIIRQVICGMQDAQGNLLTSVGDYQVLNPALNVSEPVRRMVKELCQLGWLYKKVNSRSSEGGFVRESLDVALNQEMSEYYRWMAVVQNMLKEGSLTLRKMVVWSSDTFQRMKWLAVFCQAVKPFKGAKVVSIINSYRPHGSPPIMQLLNRLIFQIVKPLLKFIQMWVYRGELFDPHQEFFINHDQSVGSASFWLRKYKLIESSVPNLMTTSTAKMVFNIGKTINFLRRCCGHEFQIDLEQIESHLVLDSRSSANSFSGDFTEWLTKCESVADQELLSVMYNKFKLKQHLDAIRRFLLMGQGDFVQVLMDTLSEELSKPTVSVFRHNLIPILEGALRASNAQFLDKDVNNRVNAKMLQEQGDNWDLFYLDYEVDEPINTMLTPTLMQRYILIFRFLWKFKRVEKALGTIFLSHINEISRRPANQGKETETKKKMKEYESKFHTLFNECFYLREVMQHFLNNIFSYVLLTIESVWNRFMEALNTASKFDEILRLHEQLVSELLEICFLTPKSKNIQSTLGVLFQQILNFKHRQDIILDSYQLLKEAVRSMTVAEKHATQYSKGSKAEVSVPSFFNENKTSEALFDSSRKIGEARDYFSKVIREFLALLEKEGDKYSILSFRVDFNEYYKLMPYSKKNIKF